MADKKISGLTAAATPLAGSEVLPIVQSGSTVKVSVDNLTAGKKVTASRFVAGTADSTVSVVEAATTSSGTTTRNLLLQNTAAELNSGVQIDLMASGNTNRVAYIKGVNVSGAGGAMDVLIATNGDYGTPVDQFKVSSAGNITALTGNLVVGTAGKGIDFSANTNAAGMTSELLTWYEEGTWTPTANGITYAAGTTGNYTRIGNLVTCTFKVVFPTTADASNAQIQGLPFTSGSNSAPTFGNYSSGFNGALASGNTYIGLVNTTGTAFIANSTLSTQTLVGSISYQV